MPTPDYDGIHAVVSSIISDAQRRLFHSLLLAMRNGELPSINIIWRWAICPRCEGSGGTSDHFGVISSDELGEWSDEFRDAYARGDFDQPCQRCEGSGKVQVIDETCLEPAHLDHIAEYHRQAAVAAAEYRAEALLGC